mgnify:CR=1 FL=1
MSDDKLRNELRKIFIEEINDQFTTYIVKPRMPYRNRHWDEDTPFEKKVEIMFKGRFFYGCNHRYKKGKIFFDHDFTDRLAMLRNFHITVKELAEALGWQYIDDTKDGRDYAVVSYDDFVKFLAGTNNQN